MFGGKEGLGRGIKVLGLPRKRLEAVVSIPQQNLQGILQRWCDLGPERPGVTTV